MAKQSKKHGPKAIGKEKKWHRPAKKLKFSSNPLTELRLRFFKIKKPFADSRTVFYNTLTLELQAAYHIKIILLKLTKNFMSVKKSSLEAKRYYRLIKVLLSLLPLAIIIFFVVKWTITIPEFTKATMAKVVQKNVIYIVGAILWYIAYMLIINGIRRLILYIGFGWWEVDNKKISMIKKSLLESKRRYRISKVILLLLPVGVLAWFFIQGQIILPEITQKNITDVIEKNYLYLIYIVAGYGAYLLILRGIWKLIMYVVFGGIENDTLPKPIITRPSRFHPVIASAIQPVKEDNSGLWFLILLIIIIRIISYGPGINTTSSIINPTPPKTTCIPTGCGHDRRSYCTNWCYTTQSACMQAGSCSSKMCRQCP